jgi:tetratricopeptide (TPR) repeat protein
MRGRFLMSLTALCAVVSSELHAFQRPPMPCDQFAAAVRADPNDLAAATALGRCSVRDYELIAPGGDSTRLMFRSSWSVALRALRHAVEHDPAYANAYPPLFRILFADSRDGCSSVTLECRYVSPVLRAGDSLLTVPRLVVSNGTPNTYDDVVQQSQDTRRASLIEARDIATRWAAVAPNEPRPHGYLGQALLRLGDAGPAANELELAAGLGTSASRRALFWNRMEALILTNRGADARRVLDEAAADPGRDTTQLRSWTLSGLNALLGRLRPPPVDSVRMRQIRARMDSMVRALPVPTTRPPSMSDLLAAGDTNGARRLLARIDSSNAPRQGMSRFRRFDESTLWSAEQHLALGDTAIALARLTEIEQILDDRRFRFTAPMSGGARRWLGRAWLLLGDVSAALGRTDDARKMYSRVIGLWDGGDPEVKPTVDQARARLESLARR